jgi:nucleoside-diphosphate-sugar epimerase
VLKQPLKTVSVPGSVLRGVGRAADLLRGIVPAVPSVISLEAMQYATRFPLTDDRKIREQLGFRFRSPEQTLADTVKWLAAAGHIDSRWTDCL